MNQSDNEMSGFLAELATEASQKLEARRAQQLDREQIRQSVNGALQRCFQFFNPFSNHLNAIEPEINRLYTLDGKTHFSRLKWKSGMAEYRKESLADDALMDHVYFQVRLVNSENIAVIRRWEQFEDLRKGLSASGIRTQEDFIELWRNRDQKATFQVNLEPEFIVWLRFRGNYTQGVVEVEMNNLDGFGMANVQLAPDAIQAKTLEELGRFLIGRSKALPPEFRPEQNACQRRQD